jgi:hypothetical protein
MNHLTEEELVLYYYGEVLEPVDAARHLDVCEECRAHYAGLQRVLNVVDCWPVPEPAEDYGRRIWQRLGLERPRFWKPWLLPVRRWASIAAVAAMVLAAFLAGRFLPHPESGRAGLPGQVRERILLVALGDHLERSQMVLVELANADPRHELDISAEQQRAGELINQNRLYRQTAARSGETAVAGVLDELERVLLEIARGPSTLTPEEVERIRDRIKADGILFKVRVIGSTVQRKEENRL